jgi:hypothetical protein
VRFFFFKARSANVEKKPIEEEERLQSAFRDGEFIAYADTELTEPKFDIRCLALKN